MKIKTCIATALTALSLLSCGAFNNKKGIFTLKNGSQQSCGVLNPFFLNKFG
ncbi:hypothetical protein J4232_01970 [Candidatus Woesearchaeota archaeon]|nr:hypothetical protein [Candidatus Woesearchaeota archaeon]